MAALLNLFFVGFAVGHARAAPTWTNVIAVQSHGRDVTSPGQRALMRSRHEEARKLPVCALMLSVQANAAVAVQSNGE